MATIPQIVTSPGAVPSAPTGGIGGGQVRASPQMDIPAPAGPGAAQAAGAQIESQAYEQTARSGAQLAAYGEQFADQYIKAKLNVDAANRTADLSAQLHEAEFQSSKLPDRDAAAADFDSRVGKIRDDWNAQDVNPKVRAAVDANLPNQIALRRASTQQAAFGLESQTQVGQLVTNLDQYNKQAVDAQDPRLTEQLIAQANQAIDGRVAGGWLHPDVAAKMKVDFGSNVYRTKIELAMSKDMATGVALYNATKGKLNAADERAMGVMAADRTKQLDAETTVSTNMPVMGQYGNVTQWGGHIEGAAAKTGLPAPLIAAVASQESGGNAGAVSSAGARGPMQFMPGTAAAMGLKPGEEMDPAKAVPAGAAYLKQQMDKYGGDKTLALMAYNWGPANVDKWIKDGKPAAAVPAETQAYVKSVLAKEQQFGGQAAGGDQLAQARIAQFRYRQSVIDNLNLDPEAKARQLSIIDQRMSTTNAIVLEQRKSAADAADSAGQALYTGKYQAGTFQSVSDQFRAAGDNSQADAYQFMADHEAQLIEDAKNPPARESTAAKLLPGAAGRIAAQASALQRADISEARQLAVQQRTENRRLGGEQEKLFIDGLNTDIDPHALIANARDAYLYYRAAGDLAKAESIKQQLDGALEGALKAKLPPAEREKAQLEMRERIADADRGGQGLTVQEAAVAKQLNKNDAANRERWDKDALSATNDLGRIRLQPFDINMDPVNLQMWATQRTKDLTIATLSKDGNATNLRNNFFTTAEMSDLSQKLDGMRPQEAQQFLAKLAVAVPQQAIALIGQQMSKKDVVSDSYAAALGLYARGQDGDIEIANRVIEGMKWQTKGGPDGEKRIGDHRLLQQTIDTQLAQARAGMSPDAVRLQNNAINADYIALTAANPNRTDIDTVKLNQAITEIVGKTMPHNGAATIIPREIEPYEFRNGVAAITAADVANLQPTAQGQPITAEVVRQNGQFIPTGDGKYNVVIPDPLRAGRTTQLIDSNTHKPWEVDIKPLIARGVTLYAPTYSPAPNTKGLPVIAPTAPAP